MTGGVGVLSFPEELGGAPRLRGDVGEQVVVHLRAGPVGHHDAGGELGELADHPDKEDARKPVSDGLFEGVPGEVPDLYEAHLFEVGEEAHGGLLGEAAGREDEGVVALGAHDVYGLADAGPPGSGRERPHDAGGAEDGDATHYPQTGVGSFLGHSLGAGDADEDANAALFGVQDLFYGVRDHTAANVVYRRATDGESQARLGDDPHSLAAVKLDAGLLAPGDPGVEVCPVGHVRVVAGILYDDGLGPAGPHLAPLDGETNAPLLALAGELYVHLLLRLAGEERLRGGFRGGGGATPGGPAGPELFAPDPLHAPGHGGFVDLPRGRHGFSDIPSHFAEHMGETGVVQVRARPALPKAWSHKDERLPREDYGLRDLRHGELAPDGRGGGTQRRNPGDYLPLEPQLLAELYLLLDGTPEAGVAGVDA